MKLSLDDLYSAPVAQKLATAEAIYQEMGQELASDREVRAQLARLSDEGDILQQSMTDLFTLCAQCGAREDGGCCSSYMAQETDGLQLLMNMLLGVKVVVQRDDHECRYLGPEGCIFPLKPFFCLNYNCQQIIKANTPAALAPYLRASGRLLQQQYRLEQLLLEILRQKGILV
ncbi:MAG: hypothetical protein ABFR97_04805 [Thermodesulfobacteriota bacterium]